MSTPQNCVGGKGILGRLRFFAPSCKYCLVQLYTPYWARRRGCTCQVILGFMQEQGRCLPFCVVLLNCCAYHSGQGSGQGRGQGREDVHCSLVITRKIVLCPMPSSTTGAFAASSHPAAATRQWPKYKHLLGQ